MLCAAAMEERRRIVDASKARIVVYVVEMRDGQDCGQRGCAKAR